METTSFRDTGKDRINSAVVHNKDLIQSYILTTAKYDYTIYEKRILYRLIEMAQSQVRKRRVYQDRAYHLGGSEVHIPDFVLP